MSGFPKTAILLACQFVLLPALVVSIGQAPQPLSAKMPGKKGGEKGPQKKPTSKAFSVGKGVADDDVLPFVPAKPAL